MRQKSTIGAFVRVPIDELHHTYGRILPNGVYAFYDYKTTSDEIDLNEIEKAPVLFKLIVHRSVISHWKKVGVKELTEELKQPVPFFHQAIGKPEECHIYLEGKYHRVSKSECEGLERLAVWEHHHVEDRLKAHYNEMVSLFVISLRLK